MDVKRISAYLQFEYESLEHADAPVSAWQQLAQQLDDARGRGKAYLATVQDARFARGLSVSSDDAEARRKVAAVFFAVQELAELRRRVDRKLGRTEP